MTARSASKIKNALTKKGMNSTEGTKHVMFTLKVDGVAEVVTRMSRNLRDIDDYLGSQMAKQCLLSNREFWELIDCTLSEADWVAIIKRKYQTEI